MGWVGVGGVCALRLDASHLLVLGFSGFCFVGSACVVGLVERVIMLPISLRMLSGRFFILDRTAGHRGGGKIGRAGRGGRRRLQRPVDGQVGTAPATARVRAQPAARAPGQAARLHRPPRFIRRRSRQPCRHPANCAVWFLCSVCFLWHCWLSVVVSV